MTDHYPEGAIAEDTANGGTVTATGPGTELVPLTDGELEQILAAYTVDLRAWIKGIMSTSDFTETPAEEQTLGILAQIIGAETSEEALACMNLERAKDLCGDTPGGRSPVLEIHSARPLKSDYAEGAGCYVVVKAVRLDTGQRVSFTTGSRAVQTTIWKHAYEGWMPFRACLEIKKERTKAGYYPLGLVAGI